MKQPKRIPPLASMAFVLLAAVIHMGAGDCSPSATDPSGIDELYITDNGAVINSVQLTVGATFQAGTRAYDGNGNGLLPDTYEAIWGSSNDAVATVSPTGVITGVAPGEAIIRVAVEGLEDEITVTVVQDPAGTPASVAVKPGVYYLIGGETQQFEAEVRNADGVVLPGVTVTWESTDPSVGTIDQSGLFTALARGSTQVLATVDGVTNDPPHPLTVRNRVVKIEASPSSITLPVGGTQKITRTYLDANGESVSVLDVENDGYASSDYTVAGVNTSGTVDARAVGTAVILLTADDVTLEVPVQVVPAVATVQVSPAAKTLAVGETVQLTATALDAGGTAVSAGSATWSSADPDRVTVSASGLVTAVAPTTGPVAVSATVQGKSGAAQITVEQGSGGTTETATLAGVDVYSKKRLADGSEETFMNLLVAGDHEANGDASLQAFVVYLPGNVVPSGGTVESARVTVTIDASEFEGSPFALGNLMVERSLDGQLNEGALQADAIPVAGAAGTFTVDVKPLVVAALQDGKTHVTLRFRFPQLGNGNAQTDYTIFTVSALELTYTH